MCLETHIRAEELGNGWTVAVYDNFGQRHDYVKLGDKFYAVQFPHEEKNFPPDELLYVVGKVGVRESDDLR